MPIRKVLRVAIFALIVSACATGPRPETSPTPKPIGKGKGLFLLDFDYETGRVTDVHVLESTGSAKLDDASIRTFKRWRCKPHTYKHVKVPITYNLQKAL